MVLGGRAAQAVERVEDALFKSIAAAGGLFFPRAVVKGLDGALSASTSASVRLPGWRDGTGSREEGIFREAFAKMAASPYAENLRLIGILALRRLSRLIVYFALGAIFIAALAVDGFLERRLAHHRMTGGRPSLFAGLGLLPTGLIGTLVIASILPVVIPEWCFWAAPAAAGLILRGMAARWHRMPR